MLFGIPNTYLEFQICDWSYQITEKVFLSYQEQELDQQLSDEQNYWQTIRGVRSFMWWHQVPEFESTSSSQDDNPFAGLRTQAIGKVPVKLPSHECLCRKMKKLNITLTEGYPTCGSKTFVVPKTEKWYDMCAEKKDFSWSKVPCWTDALARLNSFFPRIARQSLPLAPASRPIPQDTLRRWERSARHQSDWSKVSLYPSPSFLYKNQLAKEGPDSVPPVVIPALTPNLDKSLKADGSLCPVRALH